MTESSQAPPQRRGLWSQATAAAARTPDRRNRYVDFLRAVSILAVILGHWIGAAPFVTGGELNLGLVIEYQPWSRWLTWGFQVMPVFFLVGGYSNGVSWEAALRDGRGYGEWLNARLQRLIGPVLPLLFLWVVLGAGAHQIGVDPELIKSGSQMALIPIWFLAVYVMVVVLAPVTHAAWRRFGLASFWALVLAAVVDDILFFVAGLRGFGWLNYGFIWLAVHQLGYAWHGGKLHGPRKAILWALGGMTLLLGLVFFGPYPVSMVSVPGEALSNSLPPKLPMLALGLWQCGLFLTMEGPLRRWLQRAKPWTGTVLINGMIMTIYLWHLTAATLVMGVALLLGDIGLSVLPGSGLWWALRPAWMAVYLVALIPLVLLFGRFEGARRGVAAVAPWRLVLGAAMVCGGLALLALNGIGGTGWFGLSVTVLFLPIAGAFLAGVLPTGRPPKVT